MKDPVLSTEFESGQAACPCQSMKAGLEADIGATTAVGEPYWVAGVVTDCRCKVFSAGNNIQARIYGNGVCGREHAACSMLNGSHPSPSTPLTVVLSK